MKTLKTLQVTAILIIYNINIHSKCCEGCRTRTWNDNIAEEHTQKIKSKKSKKSKKDGKDGKLKIIRQIKSKYLYSLIKQMEI